MRAAGLLLVTGSLVVVGLLAACSSAQTLATPQGGNDPNDPVAPFPVRPKVDPKTSDTRLERRASASRSRRATPA